MSEYVGGAQGPGGRRTADGGELLREAAEEVRDLAKCEIRLAREEIRTEFAQVKAGAIALAGAALLAVSAFTLFMTTVALAFGTPWVAAIVMGGVLLVLAAVLGIAGRSALPRAPMAVTKRRLESDVNQLKDRIA